MLWGSETISAAYPVALIPSHNSTNVNFLMRMRAFGVVECDGILYGDGRDFPRYADYDEICGLLLEQSRYKVGYR